MGTNTYPKNIVQLDNELKELFKLEYLKKITHRFCLLYSQIGDIFHYLTHDPLFNPPARPWGSKSDHKVNIAQCWMQLLITFTAAGLNLREVFRDSLGLPKNSESPLPLVWLDKKLAVRIKPSDPQGLAEAYLDMTINVSRFLNSARDKHPSNNQVDDRVLITSANSLRSLLFVILMNGYTVSEIIKLGLDNQRSLEWAKKESPSADGVEIVGLIAMPGRISGKAYVVSKDNPLESFPKESGWILVINHAKPDYIEAIKRAWAIVTDNGGVTCHAANYAREFEVPCLVGTGNATVKIPHGANILVEAVKLLNKENKGRVEIIG